MIACESLVDIEQEPEVVRRFLLDMSSAPSAGLLSLRGPLDVDLAFAATSPFALRVQLALRRFAGGTRVLVRVEADPGAYYGIPESVVGTILRRRLAADLVTLRELLEAEAPAVR